MPKLSIRDVTNVLQEIQQIRGRDAGNVLRTFSRVRMRDENNVLRIVYQDFSVSIPSEVFKSSSGAAASGTVTTASVASTVAGGIGALTYLWKKYNAPGVTNDSGFTITTPAASATTFSATVSDGASRNTKVCHFQLTVTDSTGAEIPSNVVEVTLEWIDTR